MPVLFWLINAFWLTLLLVLAPFVVLRRITQGKSVAGLSQKLCGRYPLRTSDRPCIWFHAVSVGEVLLLQSIIRDWGIRYPRTDIVITTTTSTGYEVARSRFPDCTIHWFPLDFSWAVCRAMRRIRPDLIALVELELWPNFILHARRFGIPLALVNGRMSERSFRGYRHVRPVMRRLLNCFDVIAAQSRTSADRLIALGAPEDRVVVTGSVKFDRIQSDRNNPATQELRLSFGIVPLEPVFVAGSTQAPEEQIAIDAWQQLRAEFPALRLILVPRHKERFEEVAALVRRCGLPLVRRSECVPSDGTSAASMSPSPVLLLDTLGELTACWGLATVAFVGGSFGDRGGQNMIEPAAYGAAVLFGPNTRNFRDVVDALLTNAAAEVVATPGDLAKAVAGLLREPERAASMGHRARTFVLSQQGATTLTIDLLEAPLQSRLTGIDAAVGD